MAEVLVRLREEERALLPPGEFLPVFEHFGMMPQLDRWVVRHTVQRLAQGSRIARFTVNVSEQTLRGRGIPALRRDSRGAQVRRCAGVARSSRSTRATRSTRLDAARALRSRHQARSAAALLIDGFGRRAVSFTPVKALRRAIRQGRRQHHAQAAHERSARARRLNAILRVGERFGFGVIAECVEEQDSLERLDAQVSHAHGCRLPASGFGSSLAAASPIADIVCSEDPSGGSRSLPAAMAKWPNVPAVYGWLSLDRRGNWLIRHGATASPNARVARIHRAQLRGRRMPAAGISRTGRSGCT